MKIRQVRKRDGQIVPFDKARIADAIFKAAQAVGGSNRITAEFLSDKVTEMLERNMPFGAIPNIEDIQDVVEKVLIEEGHAKTAKAYILYRSERAKIREEQKKILNGKTTKLPFSMNALQVVAKRYLIHDRNDGVIESPEEMFFRVASTLAEVEHLYGRSESDIDRLRKEFYSILANFEFTTAGRTLANAGAPTPIVPNCIVFHMDDSMDGIFQTLKEASVMQQAGSGLGFPFHLLRPAGSVAKRSRGVASGPVSFLRVYNTAFGVIKQQNRHGANMSVMRVDHPDILEFVHAKDVEGDINNFNISVGLTNDFMQKVQDNDQSPWLCEWNGQKMRPRRIYRDAHGVIVDIKEETMTARELFQEIISSAWKTGEPGCVFLDKVNETNPLPGLGRIEACNPCVTADTLVSTEHGMMRMQDVAEKYGKGELRIVTDNRIPTEVHHSDGTITLLYRKMGKGTSLNEISAAWKSGVKPVWRLTTDFGYELEATADHKIMTTDGWVKIGDLKTGHRALVQPCEGKPDTDEIKSVEYIGEKDVYDLTEPATHSFTANGIVVSNCGEQFLHDGDVCNLGSINLEKFVVDEKVDFDRLRYVTRLAVRMLDNVIDLTSAPVEKVNVSIRSNRRVGLGIMGFADMLYQLHVPYNSDDGFKTAEKVMKCIRDAAHEMSQELAEEKGVFPNWDKSVYKQQGIKMRNAALTNIAPTGTISMVFDVSGGVEPYFALAYHYQGILGGNTQLYYVNKHLKKELERYGIYTNDIMKRINEEGTLQNIHEIPDELRSVFVTAMDISSEDHTRMQASFQKYCDNAISKTINFPEDATKEDVLQGYILAWQLGCKGCTVYRNNSRVVQVLNLNKKKEEDEVEAPEDIVVKAVAGGGSIQERKDCPDCSAKLEFKEGCVQCPECGWGKCSL